MGEIVLVRHGQANSTATSERDYDRLSDLGHEQAAMLGAWMREHEAGFDRVVCGTLRRHRETAAGMGHAAPEVDGRWDELDYFTLAAAHARAGGGEVTPEGFPDHIVAVMEAWHAARIEGRESFGAFEARVGAAMREVAAEGRRVLVVTSGGVIGMALRHVLGLDPARMARVLVPIRNSSVHRIAIHGPAAMMAGFNATPHLDAPERAGARTTF